MIANRKILRARLPLALYGFGAFALSVCLVTWNNPVIYSKLQKARQAYEVRSELPPYELIYRAGGNVPPYKWEYWVIIIGLIVIPLLLFVPTILKFLRMRNTPLSRCVYSVALFALAYAVTLPNFGWLPSLFVWLLAFGFIVGLIDGFNPYTINFSFLKRRDISEQVKLSNLQMEYNKLVWGLNLFTGFVIAAAVTGLMSYILASHPLVSAEETTMAFAIALYAIVGLALGVYWSAIKQVNLINKKILEIKKTSSTAKDQSI